MARLRNRITKATFWNDPELLRWPRDKRTTYKGIWALAEDSGCLEDDPFEWKLVLWPSPMDADITVEVLAQWRDELVEAGKLVPYVADGKSYLYAANFHQHERPRNPQPPDLPLPQWVRYEAREVQRKDGRTNTVHSYEVATDSVPSPNGARTGSPVRSCPVRSGTDRTLVPKEDAAAVAGAREHEAPPAAEERSSSIEDQPPKKTPTPPNPMDDDDPMDALLLELWEVEGWKRRPKDDRAELARLGAAFPRADLAAAIQQLRAKALDGAVKANPRSALQAFVKQLHLQTPEARVIEDDAPPGPRAIADWKTQAECAAEAAASARRMAAGGVP